MSLKIESYIARNKNFVVKDLDNIDENLFVNTSAIEELDRKNIDSDYIEGVLLIEHNGKVILGFKEYDLIDQLLMYFVEAFDKFKEISEATFSFPDQPLPVRIEKKENGFCTLSFNNNKTTLPEINFILSMLDAAEFFFNQLLLVLPEEQFFIAQKIDYIKKVRNKYII